MDGGVDGWMGEERCVCRCVEGYTSGIRDSHTAGGDEKRGGGGMSNACQTPNVYVRGTK